MVVTIDGSYADVKVEVASDNNIVLSFSNNDDVDGEIYLTMSEADMLMAALKTLMYKD